jgi:hypothetical protein
MPFYLNGGTAGSPTAVSSGSASTYTSTMIPAMTPVVNVVDNRIYYTSSTSAYSDIYRPPWFIIQMATNTSTVTQPSYASQLADDWVHLQPWNEVAPIYRPASPAIIRPDREAIERREAQRELDQYSEAIAACNMQEAERINRLINARVEANLARQREIAAATAAREQEAQRRTAAIDRARELLLENLTPEQRRTVGQNNWFVVEGGRSKTKYRINTGCGYSGNIEVLDQSDSVRHRLCCHVNTGRVAVPLGDHLLAQKIMLELAEDDFLRMANVHR